MLKLLSVWSFEIAITIISVIFVYYIFKFYYSSSKSVKSQFLSRLKTFSGIFLAQTIFTTVSSIFLSMKYNEVVAIPMLIISLLELLGFIYLFRIVRE
ncbi:hypothetical protein Calag_0257 [Caldisphaera lagunensis DSM 15908]|uniref:Uncharacterized protein n=1 Tax=Caldisphaera lagunensis (strain DSM 15908 / JCM 11604 / ANMR 0165 / IC-154) TaxID=1056495 RepID=L0A842_CALLD|nr:hypothetical protein [Caldisphaera lagunensis]AFZ70038.1 hypothetical protein Calag_0257 [Caldisphaera lagunensis DSM 15908]